MLDRQSDRTIDLKAQRRFQTGFQAILSSWSVDENVARSYSTTTTTQSKPWSSAYFDGRFRRRVFDPIVHGGSHHHLQPAVLESAAGPGRPADHHHRHHQQHCTWPTTTSTTTAAAAALLVLLSLCSSTERVASGGAVCKLTAGSRAEELCRRRRKSTLGESSTTQEKRARGRALLASLSGAKGAQVAATDHVGDDPTPV